MKTDRDRLLERVRDSERLLRKWLEKKHRQQAEYLERITADWSEPTERQEDERSDS
jgi:hypothetical protein